MDTISIENRSRNMAAIRSANTKPEIIIRKLLFNNGFRYRLHSKALLGKPDIYLKKYNTVIFVHGCFWHQHKGCKRSGIPKSNLNYWVEKLKNNTTRFNYQKKELLNRGFKVIIVWECQTKDINNLKKLVITKIKE